ncbi:MAG: tetratricopeptide repeat protein [Pyrinomonadaceae bacterium]|nr:tetratricopeptide repeat protein [Sphingobacteriaceae bacterium]
MVVAVLPFQNVSDNTHLDYFAIGFTEDIIADLSKFNNLQVISHHSTMAYSQKLLSETELAVQLQTDFLVRGSFRIADEKLRISVQLIRTESNTIVWAEKYDQDLNTVFALQDDITQHIVSSIQNNIDINILSVNRKKPITSLAAYDCWLKGYSLLKKGTVEDDLEARMYFNQALDIDANYARAYTGLSLSYFNEWSCQLWEKWNESQEGAFCYAQKAVAIDEYDSVSLSVLARIYLYKEEFEKAEHCARKSLRLNPNNADILTQIATTFTYLGYAVEAEKLYLNALRLNPLNQERYNGIGLFIYFELGKIEKAVEISQKLSVGDSWVDISAFTAAAFYCDGDIEKARFYWEQFEENFRKKIAKGKPFTRQDAINWIYFANPFKKGTRLDYLINYFSDKNPEPELHGSVSETISSTEYYFKRNGVLWEFCFEGKAITLPEVKGFTDLAVLLNQPYTEVHCTQLMGTQVANDDYFVLDDKAKKVYQKKIQELLAEITEAEAYNDTERTLKLKKEYDELVDHLTKSLGKGGKSRKLNSPTERIRSAITWRIRSAITKVEKHHPDLATHLSKAIQTGAFCSYSPEKNIHWKTE